MARAALVALAWAAAAAAASAARYVDYSGVKMPQYGPGDYESAREPVLAPAVDDYHGHSPDASASLDYKFEEDIHGKSERPSKESDDREDWSKFARRHRKPKRLRDNENLEILEKYDAASEENSKIKMSRRLPEHRSRIKSKKSRREGSLRRKSVKHNLNRSDRTDSDIEYFQRNDDIRQANGKEIDDGMDGYEHTQTSERIIRRKPRDRHFKDRLEDDREDALQPNRRMTADRRGEPEYLMHDAERERMSDREAYRPLVEDEDTAASTERRSKAYDNYGDYYDMRRVHNIKNKLPTLLRRTSARVMPPTATSTNVLEALWNRRTGRPAPPAPAGAALSVVPLPPSTAATATTAYLVISTASTSRKTVATQAVANNASEVISLAEKSRLSILKKAQRKENVRNESSTIKPPVLLQVTDKKLTVVVVEPPTSEGPWMRAREVAADTPERVERAKRLMRRKLVARAKNIQELTDNWDEMICDYIDVSLLDSAALTLFPPRYSLAFMFLLLTV